MATTITNNMESTHRSPLQVWLVEDSEADELLMRTALRLAGLDCDFRVSSDGEKAIEFVEALDSGKDRGKVGRLPNVVLLDLNLPRKGGTRVLESIRHSHECANIPVVVVTSSDSAGDKSQAYQLGATRYFQKPLDLTEFMKLGPLVRQIVGEHPKAAAAPMPN